MTLARKIGEVKYVRKIRFFLYPAGNYDPNTRYVCNEYSGPFVEFEGQYYAMYQEGEWLGSSMGRTPKQDYAQFGSKATWRLMDKYKAVFIEILFADFAKLDQAIFYGGYMFSQNGTDVDLNPSSNYQDFADGSFIPNLMLDFRMGIISAATAYIKGGSIGGFSLRDNWLTMLPSDKGGGIKFTGDSMENYFEVKTTPKRFEIDGGISGVALKEYDFNVKHNRKSVVFRTGLNVADIYIANINNIAFRPFFSDDSSIRYGYQYAALGSGHYISDGIVEGTSWGRVKFTAASQISYLKLVEVGNKVIVATSYDNDIVLLPSHKQVETLVGYGFVDRRDGVFTFEITFVNQGDKTFYIAGRNSEGGTGLDMSKSDYPLLYGSDGNRLATLKSLAVPAKQTRRILLDYDAAEYYAFVM